MSLIDIIWNFLLFLWNGIIWFGLAFQHAFFRLFSKPPLEFILALSFPLLIDFPRYIIPDILVLINEIRLKLSGKKKEDHLDFNPFVSILVPARNEEDTIGKTIASLLETDYENKEIIVIDDGSTDKTYEVAQQYARQKSIKLYRKEVRGGKASALNYGLAMSKGEIIFSIDSDTSFDRDSIRKMVRNFKDPKVGAVSGTVKVRNRDDNLLTKLQACEYLTTIQLARRFLSMLGVITVISGAFGAYRREVLERTGGWDPGIGDDSNVTMKTRKLKMKIVFEPEAVALTTVPPTVKKLAKQRTRWARNFVRNRLRKHRDVLSPKRFGWRNSIIVITNLFYHIILSYLFCIWFIYVLIFEPEIFPAILVVILVVYTTLNFITITIASYLSERKEGEWRWVVYAPLMPFYRLMLRFVRIYAYTLEFFRLKYNDPFYPDSVWAEIPRW